MSAYDEVLKMNQARYRKYKRNFLTSSKKFLAKKIAPRTGWLRNLFSIPLTATGAGFIDFAAFHLDHGWGWLVTGISLIVLEAVIADEEN